MQTIRLRTGSAAGAFLFVVLMVVTIGYAQGVIDLPKTGQMTTYYPGDDGDLEKGLPWPSPRFVENGEGTITDMLTGLMWVKDPVAIKRTWDEAFDYLKTFNLGGYLDWRMPNVSELESLVNAGASNNATWLNSNGFILQQECYWTSTTSPQYTEDAFLLCFPNGSRGAGRKASYEVFLLPVRGESSGAIWLSRTGQTKCFDSGGNEMDCTGTGQDGEFRYGVAWTAPRFINNGDGTITDTFTGLMWTEDGNTPGPGGCNPGIYKTWNNGFDHIYCLNNFEYSGYLGYTDWRLPNGNELKSLIDYGETDIATSLNAHGFKNVQPTKYYSSTTPASGATGALTLELDDGDFLNRSKNDGGLIWPVRAGGHREITVTPGSLDFGYVAIGISSDQSVTVRNGGTAILTLGIIETPSSPFSNAGGTCINSLSVPPGGHCDIIIRFSPTSVGSFSASLNIQSDDPDESNVTVYLEGSSGPELIGEWLSFDKICKESKKGRECKVKGIFNIRNLGNQDASSSVVKFYLSSDDTYDRGDGPPLKQLPTGRIKAGKSKVKKLNYGFALGEGLSGKYIIAVFDPDNAVIEADEENNHKAYGPIP